MTEREQKFHQLVERQRDLIWHVCSDYNLSAAWETQDAFQEVLCALWRDMDAFRGDSSERTWVYRLATNTLLAIKRKMSNQPQADAEPYRPDEAAPDTEDHDHLMQLVGQLGPRDEQLVMAYLHGFSQEEMARICGCSIPTVARRLAKAREWLRENYEY
ncbi:MAG: sigma-70 family RNA polymerase sigma factor [Bacteroidales bacterium]|nr:sigma-70 family RNA polymerase sigma factor [Bacteroidales bacterium]